MADRAKRIKAEREARISGTHAAATARQAQEEEFQARVASLEPAEEANAGAGADGSVGKDAAESGGQRVEEDLHAMIMALEA